MEHGAGGCIKACHSLNFIQDVNIALMMANV